MNDPLKLIEDEKAQKDIGVMVFRMYRGAREEGASRREAFRLVAAFFEGTARAQQNDEEGASS